MKKKNLSLILLALFFSLSCNLLTGKTTAPQIAPPSPLPQVKSTQNTPAVILAGSDGKTMSIPIQSCAGQGAGQYYDLRAVTSDDLADLNRIELRVSGNHAGSGEIRDMFVSLIIGSSINLAFNGNTPQTVVTLDDNGGGHFKGISIINTASGSPAYQANQPYTFTADWVCPP